jgi:hypothetical protein
MNDFDPGPLADLAVEPAGDRWTAVFVRELRHPVDRVWAALTEPGQLAAWAPFTADRDLGTIGTATLTMVDGPTEVPMASRVLRAQPPTLLEYDWGGDLLRWELAGRCAEDGRRLAPVSRGRRPAHGRRPGRSDPGRRRAQLRLGGAARPVRGPAEPGSLARPLAAGRRGLYGRARSGCSGGAR